MKHKLKKNEHTFFYDLIIRHGAAISLRNPSNSNFIDLLHRLISILRHFTLYTLDIFSTLLSPHKKILAQVPLEVYYSKHNRFDDHPLVNFLSKWDSPSLPSTYCVLSIMDSFSEITPIQNKKYASALMIKALKNLYNSETGSFSDYNSGRADFRSSYYAIKSLGLLTKTLDVDTKYLISEIGIDKRKLFSTIMEQIDKYSELPWSDISPNFSIFEKYTYILDFLDSNFFHDHHEIISNKIREYLIISKNNKISGFKLHLNDINSSISAVKSGVLLVNNINKSGIAQIDIDIDTILENVLLELQEKEHPDLLYSELFLIYNSLVIIDTITHVRSATPHNIKTVERILEDIDSKIPRLVKSLYYKGGFLFNTNFYSSPNLYATRLFVEILKNRKCLNLINKKNLEGFLLDTYDFDSGLFRTFPYRSWYYNRNLSVKFK